MRIFLIAAITIIIAASTISALSQERRYSWPAPRYEVRVEQDVMVAMRDGVRLAPDMFFPQDSKANSL